MKSLLLLLLAPALAWAGCVSVQVSPTHRDITCSGNVAVRNPQPSTITTYITIPRPSPEAAPGYYPYRVTGVVSGGEYVNARPSYGWVEGASGRADYSTRKWR